MTLGAKIRHQCKEDWCIDCAVRDHSVQLPPLPPCRAFNTSTNLSGFANTKGRERLQLGVSNEMPDVPAITFMVHSCIAPLKVSKTSPLHSVSSVYLYWERKQKFGWAPGVGCCYCWFFGIIRTIPLKSQLPMNLPILIWISGAGIPAGNPNLPPGQRILFMLMAQRTLWRVLHSMHKWTDLLFTNRRRFFCLSFFLF